MIINEADIMSKLANKVKNFASFAKTAKTKDEKEQLSDDAQAIKSEIKEAGVDPTFSRLLISTIMAATLLLSGNANAEEPTFLKQISNKIDIGLTKANELIDRVAKEITDINPNSAKGVIGKGKLFDGNEFLEYADGGKLVYRADLGNADKSTYFLANSRYKGKTWDDAIVVLMPIE